MSQFEFINLLDCPENDSIFLSDLYFQAKIIDSPNDFFKNLPNEEQKEILTFYRSGKFFKIMYSGDVIGFIGHGIKQLDTVMIAYVFLPDFRGKGFFKPMIDQFSNWCKEKYPAKKILRANTEVTNLASISSLKKAGFKFLEEKSDGPNDNNKVIFQCFIRKLI
jgi:RimJ/RimL family protein N-acetyltransferase